MEWKAYVGLQRRREHHGREEWQQVADKVTGWEQHSHLQPKQETEQVNEEWYVAFETSESAPSKILLQHGYDAKT